MKEEINRVNTVLCPTRGGEASIPNQQHAIRVAQEKNARLVFLYVSNVHFLDHIASPVQVDMIAEQLDEIGEFVLVMAQERARETGLEAEAVVRRGEFRQALAEVVEEFAATTVVLGSGTEGTGITTPEYLADLATDLSTNFGVDVLVTAPENVVVARYPGSQADPSAE